MATTTGRSLKLVAVAALIAIPLGVAISYVLALRGGPDSAEVGGGSPVNSDPMMSTPFFAPGLQTPKSLKASEADLSDDEPVVGVSAQGRHRAYRVGAMHSISSQVVNDLIGDVPVTVTYFARLDMVRVFSALQGEALDVATGGFLNGDLMLRYHGKYVLQRTGRAIAPVREDEQVLEPFPHTRTTWRKWRDAFPGTEVFVGARASSARAVSGSDMLGRADPP